MDSKELIINVERLTGKNRIKNGRDTFLCPGILDLSKESQNKSAIKLNERGWEIDKWRCSKCYLCKLQSEYIELDKDNFPYVTNTKTKKKYSLNLKDQIHFESCLSNYTEESGISKWIYSIFRLFGIDDTYTECAISKEFVPEEMLKLLGKFKKDGVYGKSVIPDLEGRLNQFIFVFENKKSATGNDEWIIEALKQIILYASSKIYQEKNNQIIFIFCYNGSLDITERLIEVINKKPELKIIYDLFSKKPNYNFALIPSSDFFEIIKKAIKDNKKNKEDIVKLILSKKQRW